MKRFAPLTLVATTAIVLAACSQDAPEAGTEPTPLETTAEASPTERKELSDYTDEERNFLADLADLRTELDNEELVEAGLVTCYQIELTKDEDTVTGSDISDRTFSYMANYENDADNSREVVRAAVYNFCPEIVDEFDYEAMRSGPFYDDFIDERGAWRDEEIREEIENAQ
jgi:hypothetical protein